MRRVRLALVACKDSIEGPWITAQGNETEIKITELEEGSSIELRAVVGSLDLTEAFTKPGTYPLAFKRMERFRVSKKVNGSATVRLPTNVEMVLNGTS